MPEPIKIEEVKERVILVGVSEQDGDDAEDSVAELAELVKTAGAVTVGTLIQKRDPSGHLCWNRKSAGNRRHDRGTRCDRYRL